MPPRTEQDYEARRRQIMAGALQVFASKGFEKATNRDIAEAAGIRSPGLIYHYFKDKLDVFQSVMQEYAPALQLLSRSDELMGLPPREVLTQFAKALYSTFDSVATVATFRILLGESIRRPAVAEVFNTMGPGRAFAFLTRYLSHQMDLGVLRPTDPGAAVRCYIGPLIVYILTREVFPQPDSSSLSSSTMIETNVEVFLRGMEVCGDQQH